MDVASVFNVEESTGEVMATPGLLYATGDDGINVNDRDRIPRNIGIMSFLTRVRFFKDIKRKPGLKYYTFPDNTSNKTLFFKELRRFT